MSRSGDAGVVAPVHVAVLAMLILGLGGVSIDLWRVIGAHQEANQLADAAAAAAATAIAAESLYDDPLVPRLDPEEATRRACGVLQRSATGPHCGTASVAVVIDTQSVTVVVRRDLALSLLGVLVPMERAAVEVIGRSTVEVHRGVP